MRALMQRGRCTGDLLSLLTNVFYGMIRRLLKRSFTHVQAQSLQRWLSHVNVSSRSRAMVQGGGGPALITERQL